MASIEYVTIAADNPSAVGNFYTDALYLDRWVRVEQSATLTTGFRGFVLGLVVARPASVDTFVDRALRANATLLKPAAKSLWGYGGAFQAPDGTVVTVASSSKKDTGPASVAIDEIVLQLGVADVAASKRFYEDRGFSVAKSYGRKYVELDTGPITLTLNKRKSLAKTAGISEDGSGSHRLSIHSQATPFRDPDGFEWAAA